MIELSSKKDKTMIFLDNASTTRIYDEALEEYNSLKSSYNWENPSASYPF